jgi:hypothetical protein
VGIPFQAADRYIAALIAKRPHLLEGLNRLHRGGFLSFLLGSRRRDLEGQLTSQWRRELALARALNAARAELAESRRQVDLASAGMERSIRGTDQVFAPRSDEADFQRSSQELVTQIGGLQALAAALDRNRNEVRRGDLQGQCARGLLLGLRQSFEEGLTRARRRAIALVTAAGRLRAYKQHLRARLEGVAGLVATIDAASDFYSPLKSVAQGCVVVDGLLEGPPSLGETLCEVEPDSCVSIQMIEVSCRWIPRFQQALAPWVERASVIQPPLGSFMANGDRSSMLALHARAQAGRELFQRISADLAPLRQRLGRIETALTAIATFAGNGRAPLLSSIAGGLRKPTHGMLSWLERTDRRAREGLAILQALPIAEQKYLADLRSLRAYGQGAPAQQPRVKSRGFLG